MRRLDLTVGITTKDRWSDLALTIQKTRESLGTEVPIIVIDDGSEQPSPSGFAERVPNLVIRRDGGNRGYISRRNQLAELAQTRYLLSLDDDSHPLAGEMGTVVDWVDQMPNVACVGLPVANVAGFEEVESAHHEPYRCRQFIGCAHVMQLEIFRSLGGYRSELVHQGEEADFAARAHIAGLECWHHPSVKVMHYQTPTARNWRRMDFYGARNQWLWNAWYLPPGLRSLAQFRLLARRAYMAGKGMRAGHLAGIKAGFIDSRLLPPRSRPMTFDELRSWKRMDVW